MIRLLADENVHSAIWRGILRRNPRLDIVRVQDVGLSESDDPPILEWAAANGRVLVSSDLDTIINFAYERIRAGLPMPGVIIVPQSLAIGVSINDILFLASCGEPADIENQIFYLPLN